MAVGLTQLCLLVLSLTSCALYTQGCQFYPPGEYLRFVRVSESLKVGGEVLQVEVHPRRNLSIQPVDKTDDVRFFKYVSVNRTVVSIRLAQSLEDLVDQQVPQNVLKFRLVCDYLDSEDVITSYLSVTVYVEDVNDHHPIFVDAPYQVTVDELTPIGITLFRGIQAIDKDKPNTPNSEIHYSVLAGNEKGKFGIDGGARASLVLRNPLDYDMGDTNFLLTIIASDRGSPPKNSTTTIKITVTDSDDLNPRFTHDVYRTQITEFYPVTGKRIHHELTFVPQIKAYDQDLAINASVRYDLIAGNDRKLFTVDPNNGSIFLERELDLDTLPSNTFTLQIQASQVDNTLKAGVAQVEIELLDINDNQPQFEVDLYNISIVENLPNGFSVLQVVATDQDQGDNAEFVYHLVDPSQAFSIDSRTGWLTVRNQAKLDREQQTSLTMKVLAREKLPSVVTPPSDSSVKVDVTLLDANDNTPSFIPNNIYEFIVSPDVEEGAHIGTVEAVDPDLGRNGMVLYELQRGNVSDSLPQYFTINVRSGKITASKTPLPVGRHSLFVEASDQPVNPSERRFSLAVVTVEVVASIPNHGTPEFVGAPYEFWVGSDVSIGTSVGQIRITDFKDRHKLVYDLLHSYHEGVPFAVEEHSGTITVVDAMSKYDRVEYDFEAVVSDEKLLTLVTNVTIHVVHMDSIFAANTNEPIQVQFRVRENLSGALVGQLAGRNQTRVLWKPVRFVIASQPDITEQFAVSQDGTIYTQRSLDREYRESYQLTILAEGIRGRTRTGGLYQVQVIVEDENDNAPVFERPWYTGRVPENCAADCALSMEHKIRARDADAGNNAQFTLALHGEDADKFSLDRDTGVVSVRAPLDRETKESHKLWIVATDRGNLSSEVRLTVYVDDVNDNPPKFVQMKVHPSSDIELSRRSSSGVMIVVGNRTVSDITPELRNVTFAEQLLPVVSIPESLIVGSDVIQLLAVDKDKGENASITYHLFHETIISESTSPDTKFTPQHFSVHPHSGSVSVATLLPPQTEFRLNISAKDGGGLEGFIVARIRVRDINNNAPTFDKYQYEFEVLEGLYSDSIIGRINAVDADFGENAKLTYKILQKRKELKSFPFKISRDGAIIANGDLDREQLERYVFRVMAQDNGPPGHQLRSTTEVVIKVLDANDNVPEFHGYDRIVHTVRSSLDGEHDPSNRFEASIALPVYLATVVESSPPGIPVLRIYANDSDSPVNGNGMILFHIPKKNNSPQLFSIDSKEGIVTTTSTLDYEHEQKHNVTIVASDLGHPSLSSTALLIVSVIDVPELAEELTGPIFTHRYYELEVEENCATPLALISLNVSDHYRRQGMKFTIIPSEFSSMFSVDPANGTVYLTVSPDRESVDQVSVTIRAQPAKRGRAFPKMVYPVHLTDLAPNEVKVVLKIRDVNDNSPVFSLNGRPLVAAIPTSANYGYPIARLHATDVDLGASGEIRYQMLGGEAGHFAVDAVSGQIRAAASFAHHAGRVFGFDVKATDLAGSPDGRSAIANVFVYVLDESKRLVMVMNAKPIDVERHSENITWVLSNITGLDVRVRKIEPHHEDHEFNDATDLYLYAVDPMMNVILETEEFNEMLNAKQSEIRRVLEPYRILETMTDKESSPTVSTRRNNAPLLTGLEVVTIVLGCIVFLGAFTAAICVACLHKNKKNLDSKYPPATIDLSLRPKMHMDCKPRSLFHPNAFVEDSTEYGGSNRGSNSDCTRAHRAHGHQHAPTCMRHHSRQQRRRPSQRHKSGGVGLLEVSLASLHSSARDSGIGDTRRSPRGRCPCGHSSTHSSANSSNGSYEDSLKSLHRHHSQSSGGSGEHTHCSHSHSHEGNRATPPMLVRRPSERLLVPR